MFFDWAIDLCTAMNKIKDLLKRIRSTTDDRTIYVTLMPGGIIKSAGSLASLFERVSGVFSDPLLFNEREFLCKIFFQLRQNLQMNKVN